LTLEEAFNGRGAQHFSSIKTISGKIPAGVITVRASAGRKRTAGDLYLVISIQRHSLSGAKTMIFFVDAVVPLTRLI